jgi:hypothetical protein
MIFIIFGFNSILILKISDVNLMIVNNYRYRYGNFMVVRLVFDLKLRLGLYEDLYGYGYEGLFFYYLYLGLNFIDRMFIYLRFL